METLTQQARTTKPKQLKQNQLFEKKIVPRFTKMGKDKGRYKVLCSKCGNKLEESRAGKYGYCLGCHAEYMRKHRPRHSLLNEPQRKKANARSYLKEYVKKGIIVKTGCEVCGSNEKIEGHHEDYSKPLEVRWLCRKHHLEYHKTNGFS